MAHKPYGLFVKNDEPTKRDLDFIAAVVHRFSTYKAEANLHALKQVYDLPDGGTIIIQDVADIFRVIVDKQAKKEYQLEKNGLVKKYIPMFFSGVITKATYRYGEKVSFKLTEQCRHRLLKHTGKEPGEQLALERFTIEPNSGFSEFVPKSPGQWIWSQYHLHNPGWYGGTMGKLQQFVGGYGRQNLDQLPENAFERAQMKLPQEIIDKIWAEYENVRLPGYEGVPPVDGKFQYDYKWARTHAVAFDAENKPWLIMVSDFVWAMPLPIIPLTANPEFRKYVEEELQDSEIIKTLDTFGALPSGESFPSRGVAFDRWVRAGVIVKVCDVDAFKWHIPIFRGCGWSFNTLGNMAYNTGYNYDEVTGIIRCHTFKLSLNVGTSKYYYGTEPIKSTDSDLNSDQLLAMGSYIARLFDGLSGADDSLRNSIQYKLRHIPQSEILLRASGGNIEAEIEYWDRYECAPIATHSGVVSKIYSGWLYHPSKFESQPQIKFPDIDVNACISFDFSPIGKPLPVKCDTIMYAYFDGDDLKVIKYFYDQHTYKKEVDTNHEDCMTVGKWYWNEHYTNVSLTGNFYTTDLNDISETSGSRVEMTTEGEDLGYDSKPWFEFTDFFWRTGNMWRFRYHTILNKRWLINGETFDIALVVPMANRFTTIYAYKDSYGSKSYTESLGMGSVRDPYSYKYWTHHATFAFIGYWSVRNGKPYPKNGNPVWVEIEDYTPSKCSDFADQGSWVPGLPADYSWLIHPQENVWQHSGGGGSPRLKTYLKSEVFPAKDDTGYLKWMVNGGVVTASKDRPHRQYFNSSPDRLGNLMYRSSCKVSFGDSTYVNISERSESGAYKSVGKCNLVDGRGSYHFIGVINE